MAKISLRPLYRATAEGRLEHFLKLHPEVVAPEVVAALEADFSHAVEFGDLGAASLSAEAAASVHFALGNESVSAARYMDLVGLQLRAAQTVEDLQNLRTSALAAGARAQDVNLDQSALECWLIAANADSRLCTAKRSGPYPDDDWLAHLLHTLRSLADIAEMLAQTAVDRRDPGQVERFTDLLATVGDIAIEADWPAHELMAVRALLRRCGRAGERVVDSAIVALIRPDAEAARQTELSLERLFTQPDE